MLFALVSGTPEFVSALTTAWNWMQERPRFYLSTGGEMGLERYLEHVSEENIKQLAVVRKGVLKALITVELTGHYVFNIHVTSPKKTDATMISEALKATRDQLFTHLSANIITTSCPTYNSHIHKGSHLLAASCGMKPTGISWEEVAADGTIVTFTEYAITRDEYKHGRTESNNRESIPVLPEA